MILICFLKIRFEWRTGFVLKGKYICQSGNNLKSGTIRFFLKGDCHYGEWNCEVV